ncbi:MAG TPA: hypothetical protein VNI77_00540 [Nitrososphaera sp.]|nr:hypothetical protein [Nitrososphaera sp.]
MKRAKQPSHEPFERTIFTEDQDITFLKDDAIFSDTFNARRRAVDELARRYKKRAIPAIREIICASSAITGQDNEIFQKYCRLLIEELLEK